MNAPAPLLVDRRRALSRLGCGFGSLALAGLWQERHGTTSAARAAEEAGNLLAATHFAPRAKRIIFLFMQGGPSHVDTYDPKPRLEREHGNKVPFHVARTRSVSDQRVFKSLWSFKQHGECGRWVSELFPETAKHVDDLCFVRSLHTEGVAHGPATLFLHTGAGAVVRPAIGAWLDYGLGTENRNLPGFVTISPPQNMGGPRNWSNAFLPAVHQGTVLGSSGTLGKDVGFRHIANERLSAEDQRARFDLLQSLNRAQVAAGDRDLEATIDSFELAFRMQRHAPEITDLSRETQATQALYGIGRKETDDFGRKCLLARRLSEAGVRFVQVNYSDEANTPRWDQHSNMPKHADHARATDLPVAGLLTDLQARGLLEDTLVWWGGEFGRTPFAQGADGRDHNPGGFTVWLAGGGTKPGIAHGETDEYGAEAVVDKVHMHDLHATILHLLGIDHERLTYRYAGRDFRLTDVHGRVVREILA